MKVFLSSLIVVLVLAVNFCYGAPAAPGIFDVSQPDGTIFKAGQRGDEWCLWSVTANGYGIIQDRESGWWYYAIPDDKEEARPSEFPVGTIDPESLKIPKYLHVKCGERPTNYLPPRRTLPEEGDERP